MMKKITNQTTEIINDMEHTNIVTFATNEPQTVEIDGEPMIARAFSCYNWEIILNGEKVCINPSFYDGDCKEIDLTYDIYKTCELWIIYNFKKALIYNNTKSEFLGEITKVLDPRNTAERIRDLQEAGEL